MQAIVSEIDDPARESIENIWGELKAVFGLQRVAGSTHPHFTYQVAESYDDRIDAILREIAASATPFAIDTHGIGDLIREVDRKSTRLNSSHSS